MKGLIYIVLFSLTAMAVTVGFAFLTAERQKHKLTVSDFGLRALNECFYVHALHSTYIHYTIFELLES